ncbi:hypothetical protein Landi51_09875 [Colletotrichum acutatum]
MGQDTLLPRTQLGELGSTFPNQEEHPCYRYPVLPPRLSPFPPWINTAVVTPRSLLPARPLIGAAHQCWAEVCPSAEGEVSVTLSHSNRICTMQQSSAPEFILEAFADPASVRDVVKGTYHFSPVPVLFPIGILHTIFFHRFFPAVVPYTREVLDLTLPYVDDVELETMIEQRATALVRQLDAERSSSGSGGGSGGGRGQLTVQFFEKKRRKAWLMRGDEEVCWECWTVKVTVAEPRTETGWFYLPPFPLWQPDREGTHTKMKG